MKRRTAALEKRLAGLARTKDRPRLVFCFADEPEAPGEKPEAGRVLRFDFGDNGQAEEKRK